MTFVKLTGVSGKPLLLKSELIESVISDIQRVRYYGTSEVKEVGRKIKLTNGNEYNVKETVEEVEKVLEELNDIQRTKTTHRTMVY